MVEQTHGPRPSDLVLGSTMEVRSAGKETSLALERGQRVVATILEVLPGGDGYLVSLLGLTLEAKSLLALPVGSSLALEVRALTPRIELAIVPGEEFSPAAAPTAGALLIRALGTALESLGRPSGLAQLPLLPPGLQDVLLRLRDASPDAAELRALHQRLGLFHEARVARLDREPSQAAEELRNDLKALLLSVHEDAVPESRPAIDEALRVLDKFEAHEARRAALDAPLLLPLSVLPGGWVREGQLFVAPDKERKDPGGAGGPGTKLVFLLDLTVLGPLRVDATVDRDTVSASFRFVRAASVRLVERLLPELRDALEAAGLRPVSLSVERATEGRLETHDLRVTIPPPEAQLLDRRA